jgi:hypothetical protein
MKTSHPHLNLGEIAKMLSGDPPVAERLCQHLAEVCPVCAEHLRQVEALVKRFQHWNPEVAVLEGLQADDLLASLLAAGEGFPAWSAQVDGREELQTWGVAWVALERARAEIAADAGNPRARDLALLAVRIAEGLGDFYHPESVSDLKALAHAAVAAAAEPPGPDFVGSRLKHVAAAVAALERGTGDEAVAREVGSLLSRVLR